MKKAKRNEFKMEEAKKNVNELLEKDFRCVLAVTDVGMVFNGGGQDFLATLSMVINNAIENIGIPEELVRRAVELGFETYEDKDEDEDEEKENLTENINKKMLEILDLMKEQIKNK